MPGRRKIKQTGKGAPNMDISEIIKRGYRSSEAMGTLTNLIEIALLATTEPLGTTKLIAALLPEATDSEFKRLTSLLWTVRQRPDTKAFWAYTGKNTGFGTKAIHWLPLQAKRMSDYERGKAEYEAHMAKLKKERETQ